MPFMPFSSFFLGRSRAADAVARLVAAPRVRHVGFGQKWLASLFPKRPYFLFPLFPISQDAIRPSHGPESTGSECACSLRSGLNPP